MTTPLKRKAGEIATSAAKKPKANASITSFFKQPAPDAKPAGATTQTSPLSSLTNPSPADAPVAAPEFDKEQWVGKLTQEQKELLKLEIETLHESWLARLKDELLTKEFLELKRFLKKEKESGNTIFPPMEDVYSWYSRFLPLAHRCNVSCSHVNHQGPAILLFRPSKLSSSAKIPTTTSTRRTGSVSPSARLPPLHHL